VAGWLRSTDFPTTEGAYDRDYNGYYYDAFVSRFDSDLSVLTASTYLGGSSWEFVYEMTLDDAGNVYVGGHTSSENFPVTEGTYDSDYNGSGGPNEGDDLFISRFAPDLKTLSASTYAGGSAWENVYGMLWDNGTLYVSGSTSSTDFPVTAGAIQTEYSGGSKHTGDAFVISLEDSLKSLIAGTYVGGDQADGGMDMVLGADDLLFITGETGSTEFPGTETGYQPAYNGGDSDVHVTRMARDLSGEPTPTPTPGVVWYDLVMADTDLHTGDLFLLERECGNPLETLLTADEYIILDVFGLYWFWPGWTQNLDKMQLDLSSGEHRNDTILTFVWPENTGSGSGLRFWGAILFAQTMDLIDYDVVEWAYTEVH